MKFDDYLEDQLKNPEFKKEYDALEPEFAVIRATPDARHEQRVTQDEERSGKRER